MKVLDKLKEKMEDTKAKAKLKYEMTKNLTETMDRVNKSTNFVVHVRKHQKAIKFSDIKCPICQKSINTINEEEEV